MMFLTQVLAIIVIGSVGLTNFVNGKQVKAKKTYEESAICAIEVIDDLLPKICGKKDVAINILSLFSILNECKINGEAVVKLNDAKTKVALKCVIPPLVDGLNTDCGKPINLEKLFDQAERPLRNKCGIVQRVIDLVKSTSFCVL